MYHLLVTVLTFVSALRVLAQTTTPLSYDNNYDNGDLPLSAVACSNAPSLVNYSTLGSLPAYPNIGGVYTVSSDSAACGACYAVTYGEETVYILAVDVSQSGFTVSQAAMDTLTGGQAVALGRVDVSFVTVDPSACKL